MLGMPEEGVTLVELVARVEVEPREIAEGLCAHAQETLVAARAGRAEFQTTVLDRWGNAIDRLELVLMLCTHTWTEFGQRHLRPLRERLGPEGKDVQRLSALNHIVDRAMLVAHEILALAKAGYGAGALARWRSQHELMICAAFLAEGSDGLSFRLLEHEANGARRLARSYNVWARHYEEEQIGREELQEYDRSERELLERYGREFAGDYGWAHESLLRIPAYAEQHAAGNRQRGPTLLDLSVAVGLARDHTIYRVASQVVHGGDPSLILDAAEPGLVQTPVSSYTTDGIEWAVPRTAEEILLTVAALVLTFPDPPDRRMSRAIDVGGELTAAVERACDPGSDEHGA
jgi:Family of unknown function (DUF5677)